MAQADPQSDEIDLIALNRKITDEEQRGEDGRCFLEKILSEALVFRRASGEVADKADVLDGLGANPFKERSATDIAAHIVGNRALVTLIVVGIFKKDGSTHHYRNARFFTRQDGEWRLDSWYNFEVTDL
jgi:Domain of unknown function (DUF4440)